jgi:hypothetical protein
LTERIRDFWTHDTETAASEISSGVYPTPSRLEEENIECVRQAEVLLHPCQGCTYIELLVDTSKMFGHGRFEPDFFLRVLS